MFRLKIVAPTACCLAFSVAAGGVAAQSANTGGAPAAAPQISMAGAMVSMAGMSGSAVAAGTQAAAATENTPVNRINPHGLPHKTGVYRCELDRSVHVRDVATDMRSAVLRWEKKDYEMHAAETSTGALRYEHRPSGLVWIVIVGKSMLLDSKVGRQLANECRI